MQLLYLPFLSHMEEVYDIVVTFHTKEAKRSTPLTPEGCAFTSHAQGTNRHSRSFGHCSKKTIPYLCPTSDRSFTLKLISCRKVLSRHFSTDIRFMKATYNRSANLSTSTASIVINIRKHTSLYNPICSFPVRRSLC